MTTVREQWALACTKCSSDEHLQVSVRTLADLYPDGTEPCGDQEWDEASFIRCRACNHTGTVKDFQIREKTP
jgi:hypothetical protein